MLKVAQRQIVGHYTEIILKNISNYKVVQKIQNNCIRYSYNHLYCKTIHAIYCEKVIFMEPSVDGKLLELISFK